MNHDLHNAQATLLKRRWFLRDCGVGMAGLALHSLLAARLKRRNPKIRSPQDFRIFRGRSNGSCICFRPVRPAIWRCSTISPN